MLKLYNISVIKYRKKQNITSTRFLENSVKMKAYALKWLIPITKVILEILI